MNKVTGMALFKELYYWQSAIHSDANIQAEADCDETDDADSEPKPVSHTVGTSALDIELRYNRTA